MSNSLSNKWFVLATRKSKAYHIFPQIINFTQKRAVDSIKNKYTKSDKKALKKKGIKKSNANERKYGMNAMHTKPQQQKQQKGSKSN